MINVRLFICVTLMHVQRVKVQLQSFVTSPLYESDWSGTCPSCLIPGKALPVAIAIEGWMDSRRVRCHFTVTHTVHILACYVHRHVLLDIMFLKIVIRKCIICSHLHLLCFLVRVLFLLCKTHTVSLLFCVVFRSL